MMSIPWLISALVVIMLHTSVSGSVGDASRLARCLNTARVDFPESAQFRSYQAAPENPRRVFAFSEVEPANATTCELRARINDEYAVKKGVQGKAKAYVHFNVCQMRSALADLRRSPSGLYWNGSQPDLRFWRPALIAHDGASRGGKAHSMLKGHRKASALASELGFTTGGPRNAWRTYRTCAVVGGAPSLAVEAHGDEIDTHDAVIRFNDHPAGGAFARHVGSRTTFRVLNSLYASLPSPAPTEQIIQMCQTGRRVSSAMARAAQEGHARRHLLDPEIYRTYYETFGSGGLTGSLGLWFALAACERVSLYGFSTPCDLGSKYRHYHIHTGLNMERVQVNTVKVVLWTHLLWCSGLVAYGGGGLGGVGDRQHNDDMASGGVPPPRPMRDPAINHAKVPLRCPLTSSAAVPS